MSFRIRRASVTVACTALLACLVQTGATAEVARTHVAQVPTPVPAASVPRKAAVVTRHRVSTGQAAVLHHWGRVVAGDEFTYVGQPRSKTWRVYDNDGHNGHGRRRPSAWHVNGQHAVVSGNSKGTTGGMSAKHGQKYGRWETRMRTNVRDSEYHPAVLLWPDVPTRSTCPEVDFAEGTRDTRKVKFFLHYGCAPKQTSAARFLDTTQWHNYAVEWTPTHITGYIDGRQWFTDRTRSHLPRGSMHLTLQLDWFPDGTPTRRSTMELAWVRVYGRG